MYMYTRKCTCISYMYKDTRIVPECFRGVGFESEVLILVSRCTITTSTAMWRENHKTEMREREREREREGEEERNRKRRTHSCAPPQNIASQLIQVQCLRRIVYTLMKAEKDHLPHLANQRHCYTNAEALPPRLQ